MVRLLWICLTIVSAASATGLVWGPAPDERHLDSSIAQRANEYGDHSGSSVFADARLFRRARWRPGGGGGGNGGGAGGAGDGGGGSPTTTGGAETQLPPTDSPPPDSPPPDTPPPSDTAPTTSSPPPDPAPTTQSTPPPGPQQPTTTPPGATVASVAPHNTTPSVSTATSPASPPPPQPQNQVTTSNTPSSMLAVYIIVGIAGLLILIAVVLHIIRGKRVAAAASRSQSRVSYPFIGHGRSAGSREEGFTMVQTRSADVATPTDSTHHAPPQPLVHDVPHYDTLGTSHMYPSAVSTLEPQSRWSRDF